MKKELTDICAYLNNYFVRSKVAATITIEGGTFSAEFLKEGQYFRILGSDFNDGVHQYPATDLKDETFTGEIWKMIVPETIIDLSAIIKEWRTKYENANSNMLSPYNSESFGNYSYSKGSTGSAGSGTTNPNSWQSVFSAQLAPYRRLRGLQ